MSSLRISTEGNLWIAVWASSRVMVFSPEGRHMKDIVFSARNMACTTWGGKDLNILFIVSASDRQKLGRKDDEGGHMFKYIAPPETKGTAKYEFLG